jgi:hypothetical protein
LIPPENEEIAPQRHRERRDGTEKRGKKRKPQMNTDKH